MSLSQLQDLGYDGYFKTRQVCELSDNAKDNKRHTGHACFYRLVKSPVLHTWLAGQFLEKIELETGLSPALSTVLF